MKASIKHTTSILIVGGGPIGLFLAICLSRAGIDCTVIEQKEKGVNHSRALGIHPVVLRLFEEIGILSPFLKESIRIVKGIAIGHQSKLGELHFDKQKMGPLSCPQYLTEQILEEQLKALNPNALWRKASFQDYQETATGISAIINTEDGPKSILCDFLIGCDGKNSKVREATGIAFEGKRYPDTYLMGDFMDNSSFGTDVLVYLPKEGVIESFPIPGKRRRWVVKTDNYLEDPSVDQLKALVKNRIQYDLEDVEHFMLGSFGVQKLIASSFQKGRVLLAGDAAHIVSPIGGQGMNLGWLDAWALTQALKNIKDGKVSWESAFKNYNAKQRKLALKVLNRAEANMKMGRAVNRTGIRDFLLRIMLTPPLNKLAKQLFTMEKLNSWPI